MADSGSMTCNADTLFIGADSVGVGSLVYYSTPGQLQPAIYEQAKPKKREESELCLATKHLWK